MEYDSSNLIMCLPLILAWCVEFHEVLTIIQGMKYQYQGFTTMGTLEDRVFLLYFWILCIYHCGFEKVLPQYIFKHFCLLEEDVSEVSI